jgi:hypothetical protein
VGRLVSELFASQAVANSIPEATATVAIHVLKDALLGESRFQVLLGDSAVGLPLVIVRLPDEQDLSTSETATVILVTDEGKKEDALVI